MNKHPASGQSDNPESSDNPRDPKDRDALGRAVMKRLLEDPMLLKNPERLTPECLARNSGLELSALELPTEDPTASDTSTLNAVLMRRQATGDVNRQSVIHPESLVELPAVKPVVRDSSRDVVRDKIERPLAKLSTKRYAQYKAKSSESPDMAVEALSDAEHTADEPSSPEGLRKTQRQLEQVRRRQMAHLEKRREQKKRKVLFQRAKRLASVGYFLLLVAAIWMLAKSQIWVFSGKAYRIENNHLLTARHVQPIINAYQGWAMYDINPQDIAHMIKTHYGIADQVFVRRSLFPAELSIYVVEKQPFAEFYADESSTIPYALATTDYSLVPLTLYRYKPQSNPNIVRMILPGGMTLTRVMMERLYQLAHLLRHMPRLRLIDVVITPTPNVGAFETVTVHFAEGTVLLGALDAEAAQRASRLAGLADKMIELQTDIQAVDLRWSEQITFVKKPTTALKLQPSTVAEPETITASPKTPPGTAAATATAAPQKTTVSPRGTSRPAAH